ncbi:MAG: HEAT repeat domain-containing protein [Pirellulales bacterium]
MLLFRCSSTDAALTPESPEVKAAVKRGTDFLATASDQRFGGSSLVALALYKSGADEDHPQVQRAVNDIRNYIAKGPHGQRDEMYSLSLSLILLAEVDSEGYASEISWLLERILADQKSHGAWGYINESGGDTSQTQYGVLAIWTAVQAGYVVPDEVWKSVMGWMIRTQDYSGGFAYHPFDPGTYVREIQGNSTNSLTSAAMGSLYVCLDYFNNAGRKAHDPTVPSALHSANGEAKRVGTGFDRKRLFGALTDGNRWTLEHFDVAPGTYHHYYMYAFERYQSFKEASGNTEFPVADWYSRIARHLLDSQSDQGSWQSRCGAACDTAFSVLFLIRSTRKSLTEAGRFGSGVLVGGRGIPSGDGEFVVQMGRVVARPHKGPADELLGMMDDPNHPEYLQALRGFEELAAEGDVELLDKHAARLHRLAHGSDAEARLAAVTALARTRNLDNVPTLIYALSDPDPRVATAANDGLKEISRRTRGVGPLGENGSDLRAAAIEHWKQWYLVVRPGTDFDE